MDCIDKERFLFYVFVSKKKKVRVVGMIHSCKKKKFFLSFGKIKIIQ